MKKFRPNFWQYRYLGVGIIGGKIFYSVFLQNSQPSEALKIAAILWLAFVCVGILFEDVLISDDRADNGDDTDDSDDSNSDGGDCYNGA